MQTKNRKALEDAYGIEAGPMMDAYDFFLEVGKKRSFLLKGGIVDEHRTAVTIIKDWQKGKLKV